MRFQTESQIINNIIYSKREPRELSPNSLVRERIDIALQFIVNHVNERITIEDIAAEAAVSKFHLIRSFKNEFGVTPIRLHLLLKMNKAQEMLSFNPQVKIKQVAAGMGYPDIFSFSKYFKKVIGISPSIFASRC